MRGFFQSVWPAILIVALVQSTALAWMVIDRVSLINSGREIVLDVVPIDPRSLFRGDYVILNYTISRIENARMPSDLRQNETVFVRLVRDSNADWTAVSVARELGDATGEGEITLRGRVKDIWTQSTESRPAVTVAYGIESYFVPEGKGREMEQLVRDDKIAAIVAVGEDGTAALKGIEIDGRKFYDPGLL